ncbi:MAG: 4Fe-4S binding protein [Pseudomonadota bacterium]
MPRIVVNEERCKGCELCVAACPKKIIEMSKAINRQGYFFAQITNRDLCTGCKLCAIACPDVGIQVFGKRVKREAK